MGALYITEEERQKVTVWVKQLDRTTPELTANEMLRWINLLSPETKGKFKTGSGVIEYWTQSSIAQVLKNKTLGSTKKIAKIVGPVPSDPLIDSDDDNPWDIFGEEKKKPNSSDKPDGSDGSDNDTPWNIFD